MGAMALFTEKYGDVVRMVDIGGPWSRELCGGTHVSSSAEIGLINLVGESSVGASHRRVEALVGADAFRQFAAERALVAQLTSSLRTPREQLVDRIADLSADLKAAEKKIAALQARERAARVPALAAAAETAGPVRLATAVLSDVASVDDLRSLATAVRDRIGGASLVALAAAIDGRAVIVVAASAQARDAGVSAGPLARIAAGAVGGGGGGRDDIAQGGGPDTTALDAALGAIRARLTARAA